MGARPFLSVPGLGEQPDFYLIAHRWRGSDPALRCRWRNQEEQEALNFLSSIGPSGKPYAARLQVHPSILLRPDI